MFIKKIREKYKIKKYIEELYRTGYLDNKSEFAQSEEALNHSKNYSMLLKIYVLFAGINSAIKVILKIVFFIITIWCLIQIVNVFGKCIDYTMNIFNKTKNADISYELILSTVSVVVPSIVSLIVALINIPQIIAQYLFNTKEDNYINSIIKNIQEYDINMFSMEHKIQDMLLEIRKPTIESTDEDIEDLPEENKKDKIS